MRNSFYADKRDLVKWGTMVHLCQENNLHKIVQVAFLPTKPDDLPVIRPNTGKEFDIERKVWDHFRNVRRIEELGDTLDINVRVIIDRSSREDYMQIVRDKVQSTSTELKAVLLDPDTGLEPESRPTANHVTVEEVRTIWNMLNSGDWLVLYQHASRVRNWDIAGREKFAVACGIECGCVISFKSPKHANDVALFAAKKP